MKRKSIWYNCSISVLIQVKVSVSRETRGIIKTDQKGCKVKIKITISGEIQEVLRQIGRGVKKTGNKISIKV